MNSNRLLFLRLPIIYLAVGEFISRDLMMIDVKRNYEVYFCQSKCLHYLAELYSTIQKKSDIQDGFWSDWIRYNINSFTDHLCEILHKGLVWLLHVRPGAFRNMHVYTDKGKESGTREASDENREEHFK